MTAIAWGPTKVAKLFDGYVRSRVPLATYARRVHLAPSHLRSMFRAHDPTAFAAATTARQAHPGRQYARGRAFEHAVRRHLEGLGWWCTRAAGSRGKADLVAARAGALLLIQCKAYGAPDSEERLALVSAADRAGGTPLAVDREPGSATGFRFRRCYADGFAPWVLP